MLDSIEIREVSVTKQTDGYVIAASWKTTSEGTPYQGPYELVLMNGETGAVKGQCTVKVWRCCFSALRRSGEISTAACFIWHGISGKILRLQAHMSYLRELFRRMGA